VASDPLELDEDGVDVLDWPLRDVVVEPVRPAVAVVEASLVLLDRPAPERPVDFAEPATVDPPLAGMVAPTPPTTQVPSTPHPWPAGHPYVPQQMWSGERQRAPQEIELATHPDMLPSQTEPFGQHPIESQ